ncbi:ABC transporter substrate-binding protein [Microbacterium sp. NPDC055903]
MNGKIMRRGGIAVAALTTAALALTACGGTSNGGEAPELSDEPVTINMTWWGSDSRAELTQQVIDAFEEEYPNITVEPTFGDWAGYWDGLATATAANDAADVIQMDELYIASYGSRGALADLSSLDIDLSGIPEDAVGTGQVDGVQYGAPIGVSVYSIIANKDLFDQYGVALPDDETWTWDDYAALAKELTDKSGGEIHGTGVIGGLDTGSVRYWGRSVGSELFAEDGTVSLDPQSLADMWQYQIDLIDSGASQSADAINESYAAGLSGSAISTNQVAMGMAWHAQLTAYQAANGGNLVLLKLPQPADEKPDFYKPSMYWTVSSQSEHPAEAALLVDYFLNSETAAKIIGTDRGIPANENTLAAIESDLSETDQAAIEYQNRIEAGTAPIVAPNGASGIEAMLQRYTQEVLAGQTEPAAAAEAFIAELQGEIDAAG